MVGIGKRREDAIRPRVITLRVDGYEGMSVAEQLMIGKETCMVMNG